MKFTLAFVVAFFAAVSIASPIAEAEKRKETVDMSYACRRDNTTVGYGPSC
ncbi:hypothetical protein Moror_11949 [Moniliophthora roreri MCA 2997]|uniref:Uncharacterized protein n=2 Tax=Moniliophthora roreri TaxID=221103 RepID=V2WJP5_MONRO|nr:hypothetical protein Moror_11949 [Moniliophthora roreri MCA 2997]